MTNHSNGSFDHLISQLDRRLARIEHSLDRLVDETGDKHDKLHDRVTSLENDRAKVQGGWKAASFIGGVAGAAGGIIAKYLGGS